MEKNRPQEASAVLCAELAEVQAQRCLARRKRFGRSRLDRYREPLLALRAVGASYADLQLWLRMKCRVRVAESTVRRRLLRWQHD
ncbi:MAG: hypothetical protein KDJ99_14875 [Candidatus Competibacteraceae bacterium]|nr:hypothetical protein [Candidatus Competibacteraceae bacterium]